jgi:hypothetical protein
LLSITTTVALESGRGMTIIASVAHRWGSMHVGGGKSVWAELRPQG